MFSIITIASSTTKPVAIVSAINERLFRLYPSRYMSPNVPISEIGTATLAMTVARRLPRNAKITSTTRATASSSSFSTSATEARMPVVRSASTSTCTDAGNPACSCGNCCLIASTVAITFAPGCRCTLTMIAGISVPASPSRQSLATTSAAASAPVGGCRAHESPAHAPSCVFSAASTTLATLSSRTGAPLRYATMRLRYSSAVSS
jgi:hypothetical protein